MFEEENVNESDGVIPAETGPCGMSYSIRSPTRRPVDRVEEGEVVAPSVKSFLETSRLPQTALLHKDGATVHDPNRALICKNMRREISLHHDQILTNKPDGSAAIK